MKTDGHSSAATRGRSLSGAFDGMPVTTIQRYSVPFAIFSFLKRLMNQDNRFNELIEAAPSATAIYHTRDIIIGAVNSMMLEYFGKDRSIVGMSFDNALPELSGQPFFSLLQQVFDSGIAHHSKEDPARLIVGGKLQTFYFNYTYKPVLDSDGQTTAIIHSAIDVTEMVMARKRAMDATARLELALESAEIGTWDLHPIDQTVHWDKRCRELFGFEGSADIPYGQALDCIHPDDKPKVIQAVETALDPATSNIYDIRYRTIGTTSGKLRWVHCKGRAYFNSENMVNRFAGTARDITADTTVRQSEQQLMALVNFNADHMSIADMQGNLIYMNRAGRKLLGVEMDADITALSARDFYTPQELDRVQHTIIPSIDHQTGWQGVIHLKNLLTGENFPCQINYILIKDPVTGGIIGRGATSRDLRPELKAKAELQRLATIVDISEDFCNYTDLKGNTIYMNQAGKNLIGVTEQNFSTANIYSYHSPVSSVLIGTQIMNELLEKENWSGQLELMHLSTGEIIPIHKQLFIIRDELTKEPIAIAGIARDLRAEINAKKAMDEKNAELSQALRELNFLADTMPAVVWTATPDGMLDYINQRWYERSEVPIQDSLGTKWASTMHPDDLQGTLNAWQKSLSTGSPYEVEFRLKDKYGKYRWWLVRALALTGKAGMIAKWYGTNTDITEQKELERQKDNFLGVASHELKTPVTSIKAYAQVLEMMLKRSGDEKNAALMAKMNRQINRLTHLIGDLLDVTKINTGRLQLVSEPFDFNQLMEEVIADTQLTSQNHQITAELQFKRMVTGDRERICQVIVNLLSNAVKYSPDANRIIVYTEDHGDQVQLCVQDFGIGLSRDKQDHVFEQFYRVSGTKEHTFPGLGLGLYISSEIVTQLGGRIWVNSVAGKGSTFCFAIPVEQPSVA
jgi:PAS domain S-box-containing protein